MIVVIRHPETQQFLALAVFSLIEREHYTAVLFLRARNFDCSKMKKNQTIPMPVSDASRLNNSWLEFRGRENYKMSDTKEKYRCVVFSFYERDNGKSKELLRFWVTDDDNHIPVRLDMFLSFGSAKAFLRSYKGIRSPMTAKIK